MTTLTSASSIQENVLKLSKVGFFKCLSTCWLQLPWLLAVGGGGSGMRWFGAPWGAPALAQKWVLRGRLLPGPDLWAR